MPKIQSVFSLLKLSAVLAETYSIQTNEVTTTSNPSEATVSTINKDENNDGWSQNEIKLDFFSPFVYSQSNLAKNYYLTSSIYSSCGITCEDELDYLKRAEWMADQLIQRVEDFIAQIGFGWFGVFIGI